MKLKWILRAAVLAGFSLVVAQGCGGDDDGDNGGSGGSGSDGLGSCTALCEASVEAGCASAEECQALCAGATLACGDEAEAYLSCGESKDTVTCLTGIPIGLITGCEEDGAAVQACLANAGMGGMGGMGGGN